ncbi:MAG: glycoside hydrolase family 44 protein [Acidobacteriota bacterium]
MRTLKLMLISLLMVSFFIPITLVQAQNPAITINVDANANRQAINPLIYGVAWADTTALNDLNVPLNRHGGNTTTRYNWQLNADNRANDWYYESIAYSSNLAGEQGDTFISLSKSANAQPMLTIPMLGWVAKVGSNRSKLASFSIAKYGAQTGNDWQWFPDAGNGIRANGQYVTGNDPNDANVAVDSLFQQSWMQHLVNRWGSATDGGLRYYILDNEPSIWHATHRDVHPTGATMDEVRDKIFDYAAKVKANDQSAIVVAPEEWGWTGYWLSGYDQQWGAANGWNWSLMPDRSSHGGWDYMPYLLDQLRQRNTATGQRLVDIFSLHFYPQGGEFSNDTSSNMQLRRNRSTRALWDAGYVDETWINDKVNLIPRMKNWVNTYYPNTRIAITEYNWGAENHINGATTQADILGIFGREGLDLANRWTTPDAATPTYKAIKMYRNYDGNQSTFGDTSVQATVPNPDNVSAFAALRNADGALTLMVVGKQLSGNTSATINLANFPAQGIAQVWQLTSTNQINRLSNINFTGSSLSLTIPPQSITLLVVSPATTGNQPPVASATASPTSGTAPLAVNFNGSASTDPDGTIAAYAWNFGDGATASGVTANHTYATAGTYTATLTVTDNSGASSSTNLTINVSPATAVVNAPSNLTGNVKNTRVKLFWVDNANNETGFYIERALTATGAFARVGQVGANATTYTEYPGRGNYLYRVQAFNQTTGVTSGYSNQIQLKVKQ